MNRMLVILRIFFGMGLLGWCAPLASAGVVINELMFHPQGDPVEDPDKEWIEVFNTGSEPIALGGWRFTRGVDFTFPEATVLGPGSFLVIAANLEKFRTDHPDFDTLLVGDWRGKLSNVSEELRLENVEGETVAVLDYATQGDWATRVSSPEMNGFIGWVWENLADGSGHSLERVSPHFEVNSGQLWRASTQPGGSPGRVNSVFSNDVAPVIMDVDHFPVIPQSTDFIRVTATVRDDHALPSSVRLVYRSAGIDDWRSIEVGSTGGDGDYAVSIGPFPDRSIIEYYVTASDAPGNERAWPAASFRWTTGDGLFREGVWGHFNNVLMQVDDLHRPGVWEPGSHPVYRIIMPPEQRTLLQRAQEKSSGRDPVDAQYHGSFVSVDGTGVKVRHQVSVRDRGFTSRQGNPVNFHVAFPNDSRWNDRKSIQLNSRFPFSQAMGAAMFQLAGLPTTEAVPVKVRVNGVDTADSKQVGYGRYVRAEPMNGDWISRLYPHDAEGNLYRIDDHARIGSGQFTYEGDRKDTYEITYLKKTNEELDDYSDIVALTKALNNSSPEAFRQEVEKVVNVRQWLRYLAVNWLIENMEGGLGTGRADDFGMYRGIEDSRFVLLPHDLDTVMGIGERPAQNAGDIFVYRNLRGLNRMFSEDVQTIREYYQVYLEMLDGWFTPEKVNPVIDQVLKDWVPESKVEAAKQFVVDRREQVLRQIPTRYHSAYVVEGQSWLNGIPVSPSGRARFEGRFHAGETGSIRVNGEAAQLSYGQTGGGSPGTWILPVENAVRLNRGVNAITINYFEEPNGLGKVVHSDAFEVYYAGPATEISGILAPAEVGSSSIRWRAEEGPIHLVAETTVPEGVSLQIDPGVHVYFESGVRLMVKGTIKVLGTEHQRVRFSHDPRAASVDDPLLPGLQLGSPKWAGVLLMDSISSENRIEYADFVNAQPLDNQGSIGVIRSECFIDHCRFSGTHHRMVFGRNCSLTVQYCLFPDMFAADEDPVALRLDNVAEQMKVESPELAGDPRFAGGFPVDGHLRVYHNQFHGNKGHNDVLDVDGGRWGKSPVLDCRYNHFHGPVGDEHMDLGGDAYIAFNTFENVDKDVFTSDRGYANAISTGDSGGGATVVVAGNVFHDVDHALNAKANTGAIFEHNSCLQFNRDYRYAVGAIQQDVQCSAVNLFVPDDALTTPGDGAYLGFNLFFGAAPNSVLDGVGTRAGFPRLISWADRNHPNRPAKISRIQLDHNLIDPLLVDDAIGEAHPGGVFDSRWGRGNISGLPGTRRAIHELPFGADIDEWAYIAGGVERGGTSASFVIGGPGIFAFRWRLNDGEWSDSVSIAPGIFSRNEPTVRSVELELRDLVPGAQRLEVIGQDFAGNWQPEERLTSREWMVDPTWKAVVLNEIRAVGQDFVELWNRGEALDLAGWRLAESLDDSDAYVFPEPSLVGAGEFIVVAEGIALDRDGDALLLLDPQGKLIDELHFGHQAAGFTLGRFSGAWTLTEDTLGAANVAAVIGDATKLRISEVLAAGEHLFRDDWIEIHNAASLPVALAGLRLTDNPEGDPNAHVFPAHSYIGPDGYVKLVADGKKGEGHVDFALDAEGETLALINHDGIVIDLVLITPQTRDRSMTWSENGAARYPAFPTDGFAATDIEIQRMRGLIDHLRISEIHYDPVNESEEEFIELTNTGAIPLDLTGVRFTRGIDFIFPAWELQPGAYVILSRDQEKLRQRYGSLDLPIAGIYQGKLDNSGEMLALTLPAPFGAAILDFRYEPSAEPGHSLEWTDLAMSDWQSSQVPGGSPGRNPSEGGLVPGLQGFALWAQERGIRDFESDADGDTWSAFLEYALDRNPDIKDPLEVLTVSSMGAALTLNLGEDRPDVTYEIEASTDLVQWTTLLERSEGGDWSAAVRVDDLGLGRRGITFVLENRLPPNTFLRLRVSIADRR